MGKRKEIKFLCKDGQTREGRQDGVMFWIRKDQKREQDGLPCYYVAANDTKGKGRAVAAATEQAKAFRDKLEATGISYHELLALEQAHEDLGNMAHNILLGWENGEGFPNG